MDRESPQPRIANNTYLGVFFAKAFDNAGAPLAASQDLANPKLAAHVEHGGEHRGFARQAREVHALEDVGLFLSC